MSHDPKQPLVLLNPASAAGRTGRRRDAVRAQIEAALGPVGFVETGAPGHATALAEDAARAGVERVLVAGGDGTTSEVVAGLLAATAGASRGPTLGLLPLGSGLDLIRTLGLPRELAPALDVIRRGRVRVVDAGRVEFRGDDDAPRSRGFVNEVGAGLSASTIRLVGRLAKRVGPRVGFAAGAVAAIATHRARPLRIEADDALVHEGDVSLVVAANGRYFGAGMKVAPGAKPDDGLLELVVVRRLSVPRLLWNLPSLFTGRHGSHPAVSFHAARRVTIAPVDGAARPIDVDGESLGRLPLRAEIVSGALGIFAPDEVAGGEA